MHFKIEILLNLSFLKTFLIQEDFFFLKNLLKLSMEFYFLLPPLIKG